MNEKQLQTLLRTKMNENVSSKYAIDYELKSSGSCVSTFEEIPISEIAEDLEQNVLKFAPKSDHIVSLSGICLPVCDAKNVGNPNIVMVDSTKNNLRRIALGLASNQAVCLVGSVGSGKTCLVEYLASRTGRLLGDKFIKLQLGDQTDSKMLLGTYRCADIPGEFVWQPGVLTQVSFSILGTYYIL